MGRYWVIIYYGNLRGRPVEKEVESVPPPPAASAANAFNWSERYP